MPEGRLEKSQAILQKGMNFSKSTIFKTNIYLFIFYDGTYIHSRKEMPSGGKRHRKKSPGASGGAGKKRKRSRSRSKSRTRK